MNIWIQAAAVALYSFAIVAGFGFACYAIGYLVKRYPGPSLGAFIMLLFVLLTIYAKYELEDRNARRDAKLKQLIENP